MVQVSVRRGGQRQCSEADVVQRLVVDAVSLVGVFYQLMDGQGGVVGFNNRVGYLKSKRKTLSVHCQCGTQSARRTPLS